MAGNSWGLVTTRNRWRAHPNIADCARSSFFFNFHLSSFYSHVHVVVAVYVLNVFGVALFMCVCKMCKRLQIAKAWVYNVLVAFCVFKNMNIERWTKRSRERERAVHTVWNVAEQAYDSPILQAHICSAHCVHVVVVRWLLYGDSNNSDRMGKKCFN